MPGRWQPHGDDIVVVTREYMHSREVHQAFPAWLAGLCGHCLQGRPAARGMHSRRTVLDELRGKLVRKATELRQEGAISCKARAYLVDWAQQTRRRRPRLDRYAFLDHCAGQPRGEVRARVVARQAHEARNVVVRSG